MAEADEEPKLPDDVKGDESLGAQKAESEEADARLERERDFTRRMLLQAGWTIPAIAAITMAAAPLLSEHFDFVGFEDIGHDDGGHVDQTPGHLDVGHIDGSHVDFTPHTDSPTHDDSVSRGNHIDLLGHNDALTHSDQGHQDTPHTDGTHGNPTHGDGTHADAPPHHDNLHHRDIITVPPFLDHSDQ